MLAGHAEWRLWKAQWCRSIAGNQLLTHGRLWLVPRNAGCLTGALA